MHELRLGELAHFKSIPHTPYYGTADATMQKAGLVSLHGLHFDIGSGRLLGFDNQTGHFIKLAED